MKRSALAALALTATVGAFAPPAAAQQEARVQEAHGQVEVSRPDWHAPAAGEALQRGERVRTHQNASAVIALADGTRWTLGENTTVLMFASATRPAPGQPASTDTTVVRGTLRAERAEGSAPLSVSTPSASVTLQQGRATLQVLPSRVTLLAVESGRARIRGAGREIPVREGSGTRVEVGFPPAPARPLPPAPGWTQAPPARVLTPNGAPVTVAGTLAPGRGDAPAQWHVQLARDAAFNDLVFDRVVPAASAQFRAADLPPGSYFARASAVAGSQLEGPFGAPAPVVVAAPRLVPGGNGHRAQVELPQGFYCGLDGSPLAPLTAPVALTPLRAHSLRCAANADGGGAVEIPITAQQAGPLSTRVHVDPSGFDARGGMRVVVVQLADGSGIPISYANITASATPGATVGALRESDTRGTYTGTVQWGRGLSELRLHFVVNGVEQFDYDLRPAARPVSEQASADGE